MQNNNRDRQCIISGGGAAGELMAAALAKAGVDCRLIAPRLHAKTATQARTIAIWQAGLQTLSEILGSDDLLKSGYPIRQMTLIDEKGDKSRYFPADIDLEQDYFGYNLPLEEIAAHARALNDASPHIERIEAVTKNWIAPGHLRTSNGEEHLVELAIVAEGKDSPTARAAGITPLKYNHGTVAIIAAVRHAVDHNGEAREYHRKPGPLAFVPLDAHHSSIVWIRYPDAETEQILQDETLFIDQLNADSLEQLSVEDLVTPATSIPIVSRQSTTLRAPRMALIGESAHKMPPTGAQGLNLTLRDIHTLKTLVTSAFHDGHDLGNDRLLRHYSRERALDTLCVASAVHLGNASISLGEPLAGLRRTLQHRVLPHFPKLQQRLIHTAIFGV